MAGKRGDRLLKQESKNHKKIGSVKALQIPVPTLLIWTREEAVLQLKKRQTQNLKLNLVLWVWLSACLCEAWQPSTLLHTDASEEQSQIFPLYTKCFWFSL